MRGHTGSELFYKIVLTRFRFPGNKNNLYLGNNKDQIVVQSYDTSVGHKNFRLYVEGTQSGLDFADRSPSTPHPLNHTIKDDVKYSGSP